MIIVLMGYMGSGKSTLGKDLAKVLNYRLVDLDTYISKQENLEIPKLFSTKGELYFRKQETKCLNKLLETSEDTVLALGGGTPCYGNNINLILSNPLVKLIYLKLSIVNLTKRLFEDKQTRPLISHLKTEEDLQEFIGKHLFERSEFYNKAQFIIEADNKTKKQILEDVLMQLI